MHCRCCSQNDWRHPFKRGRRFKDNAYVGHYDDVTLALIKKFYANEVPTGVASYEKSLQYLTQQIVSGEPHTEPTAYYVDREDAPQLVWQEKLDTRNIPRGARLVTRMQLYKALAYAINLFGGK